MFDISILKSKKLSELQDIAQAMGIKKFKSFKKEDLVYKIIDFQAENPSIEIKVASETKQKLVTSVENKKRGRPKKMIESSDENEIKSEKKQEIPKKEIKKTENIGKKKGKKKKKLM